MLIVLIVMTPRDGASKFDSRLEELMERYADGDEAAFAALYAELRPVIAGRLMRKAGVELAEDIVQATFLKLHAHRANYRTGTAVLPWVFTIADRLLIDAFRKRGRDPARPSDELPDPGAWDAHVDPFLSEAVRAAIETLPEYQRVVVVMHVFEGLDLHEVAERLGLEPTTVRVRKHRAWASLREKLGALMEGR
ncbi:MAG: RNA polymerase sigma factor [Deltaproteobacteria bacterium]|nr:RNA polymerase sigma factor [Deltaproteobacteria bacterium]